MTTIHGAEASAVLPRPTPFSTSWLAAKAVFYTAMLLYVLNPFVALLRVMADVIISERFFSAGHYTKVLDPLALALGALVLVARSRLRFNALMLVALLMVLNGTTVGLLHEAPARFFVAHLFVGLFVLVMYTAGMNVEWNLQWLHRVVTRASVLVVAAYLLAIVLFWGVVYATGNPLYLGISTQPLFVPLAYTVSYRRWSSSLLILALILLAGKRGPIMAVMVMLIFYLVDSVRGRILGKLLFSLAAVVALAILSFLLGRYVPEGSGLLGLIYGKWALLNPFSESFDLGLASSGRSTEIAYAFQQFSATPLNWIAGGGYGWNFFNYGAPGSSTRDFYSHYVHFSPLNFLYQNGIILAAAFLANVWRQFARAYGTIKMSYGRRSTPHALSLALLGLFVAGLFGFDYGTDPFIFFALGLLTSVARRAREGAQAATPSGRH